MTADISGLAADQLEALEYAATVAALHQVQARSIAGAEPVIAVHLQALRGCGASS